MESSGSCPKRTGIDHFDLIAVVIHLVFYGMPAVPADYFLGLPRIAVVPADLDFVFHATLGIGTGHPLGTVAHCLFVSSFYNLFFPYSVV